MDLFALALLIHVAGAIIGFGPSFAFMIMGPLAGRTGGPQALGMMKAVLAVQEKLLIPVSALTQPLTGIVLIFESGRNQNFFNFEWLWISIVLYIIAFYLSLFVQRPALQQMVALAESGKADTPEFGALGKKTKTFGPILTVLVATIVFLMIAKPGGPDSIF